MWREVRGDVCVEVWVEVRKDVEKCGGSCWESVCGECGAVKCERRCWKTLGDVGGDFF